MIVKRKVFADKSRIISHNPVTPLQTVTELTSHEDFRVVIHPSIFLERAY